MDLFIRTIGIARATTKIGMANLVYNIKRLLCLRRRLAAYSAPKAAADRKITSPMPRRSTKHHPNIAKIVQSA
jgi:hypothetical protein